MAGYYDKMGNWVERGPKQTQSSGGGGNFMDYNAYQNNLARLRYNMTRAMNNSSNSDAYIFARKEYNDYLNKYKDYDWSGGGGGGNQKPAPDPRGGGGGMRNDGGGGGGMRRNDGVKRGGGGGFRNDGNPWDKPTPVPTLPPVDTPRALVPNRPPKNAFGGGFAMPQQGFSKGGKVLSSKQLSQHGTKSKWGK